MRYQVKVHAVPQQPITKSMLARLLEALPGPGDHAKGAPDRWTARLKLDADSAEQAEAQALLTVDRAADLAGIGEWQLLGCESEIFEEPVREFPWPEMHPAKGLSWRGPKKGPPGGVREPRRPRPEPGWGHEAADPSQP